MEDERVWRDCLISIMENRLHLCTSIEEVIRIPDGVPFLGEGYDRES